MARTLYIRKGEAARHLLMRIGAAFVFVAFGAWEIYDPQYWAGFLPVFLAKPFGAASVLLVHGSILIIIGLAILIGLRLRISALLGTAVLASIIVSLLLLGGFLDLVVRDVGLLFLLLAIAFDDTRYMALTR